MKKLIIEIIFSVEMFYSIALFYLILTTEITTLEVLVVSTLVAILGRLRDKK